MINKETGNRLKQQMIDAETGDVVEARERPPSHERAQGMPGARCTRGLVCQ